MTVFNDHWCILKVLYCVHEVQNPREIVWDIYWYKANGDMLLDVL